LTPDAMRNAGLIKAIKDLGWLIKDKGNVSVDSLKGRNYGPDYGKSIININQLGDILHLIHKKNFDAADDKAFALNIGGDHSISTGSISGLKSYYPNMKVLWVSAHDDCIIPEFTKEKYRNYHGMSASHLFGCISDSMVPNFQWLPKPVLKNNELCYIGIRDLDGDERKHLKNFGIKYYTPDHISRFGIGKVMEKALNYLEADKNPIYLSLDITALDPSEAPGTATKCKEGLTYREAMYLMKRACIIYLIY